MNKSLSHLRGFFLQIFLLGASTAQAQPLYLPPPTICDSLLPINLTWTTYIPVTDSLLAVMVTKTDQAISTLPEMAELWKNDLRGRVLDKKALRCPDKGAIDVGLPYVMHASVEFNRDGFRVRRDAYRNGKLERHSIMDMDWDQPGAEFRWTEDVIDASTQRIIKRDNYRAGVLEEIIISTAEGRITAIEYWLGGRLKGLQYASVKGQDRFSYSDPVSGRSRVLDLQKPDDLKIWRSEGHFFYLQAYNGYFRLPAPLLEFAPPHESKAKYKNPFVE